VYSGGPACQAQIPRFVQKLDNPAADASTSKLIGEKPELEVESYPRYNWAVTKIVDSRLDRVLAQLQLYEHPLLDFSAQAKGEGVEVIIKFKNPDIPVHTYYFDLHPRDLDHPQFEWTFQRQLYDCLHDYLIEMFTRTPQNRVERQREGL